MWTRRRDGCDTDDTTGQQSPTAAQIPSPAAAGILIRCRARSRQGQVQVGEGHASRGDICHVVTADGEHVVVGRHKAPFHPTARNFEQLELCVPCHSTHFPLTNSQVLRPHFGATTQAVADMQPNDR